MRARPLVSLLTCALVAGVVLGVGTMANGAVPALILQTAGDAYLHMPSDLATPTAPQASYVYAADGKTLITSFYEENRRDVSLDQIAIVMQQAIVAAEDSRFYQHGGVDLRSVLRAAVSDVTSGGAAQGASTLTMQYVRNVLKTDPNLTPEQRQAATQNSLQRKLQEMRYATALEKKLSKQQILKRYLNIAYFGAGAYGIAAASQTYFSKPPSQLTLPEAALLAGLVQSPDAYNPVSGDRAAALNRRGYVLDSMAKMGVISTAQAAATKGQPLVLHASQQPNNCTAVPSGHSDWGFFCDYFRQWWDAQPQFGTTVAERESALQKGGYRIVTSLDPTIQAAAQAQSLSVYGYNNPRALPMAVVQPGTGRVLAMSVNRHYSLAANPGGRAYPNTVNQLVAGGGGVNGYQAGSTFKMFTMLAALSSGKPLNTSFNATSPLLTHFPVSGGPASCGGYWCPVNANPSWMDGQRTMWTGFGRSVNTYFAWLEEQVGPDQAVAMAQKLGIQFRAKSDAALAADSSQWGAFTLGVSATTPLDLANAYATVASGGTYCDPLPVTSITDGAGHPVAAANPICHKAIEPDVAAAAADAARCPVGQQSALGMCDGGTAQNVDQILGGRPVAGKTGSAENNATETFVGFTPQIAAAGIAANPDNPQDYVGSGVAPQVNAAVARTLAAAVSGKPYQDFPAPSSAIAFGQGGPPGQVPGSWSGPAGPRP